MGHRRHILSDGYGFYLSCWYHSSANQVCCRLGHKQQYVSRMGAINNIFIERLWHSVENDHFYLYAHKDVNEMYSGLKKYFDLYNCAWLH